MHKKKILVVDDEPVNLQLLRQILKEDYSLVFAKNGIDAISAVEKHIPNLILMDVMMSEMDGFEAARQLKAKSEYAAIPIIFVTGQGDIQGEIQGFEVGGVDYITKPVNPPTVLARVKTHLSLVQYGELEKSQQAAVYMLGEAGHYNDDDTGVHIWRMAAYSCALARKIGWDEEDVKLLNLAAPMHDTGKIGIPDSVLKKPGKLNADEWIVMKTHSQIGYDILSKSSTPLFQLAAEVALSHHERWDGSGYPSGLSGKDIPESARIVAIADVFDALTMKRPYKEPWSIEEAVEEIKRSSGKHFDPQLVDSFTTIMDEILTIKDRWANNTEVTFS